MSVKTHIGVYDSSSEREGGGLGLLASILVHTVIMTAILVQTQSEPKPEPEPLTYVELAQALPPAAGAEQRVIEAPGPEVKEAPRNAPLSDANRRASTPEPGGQQRTAQPGLNDAPFIPGSPVQGQPVPQSPPANRQQPTAEDPSEGESRAATDGLRYEEPARSNRSQQTAPQIDWTEAIQDAGRVASLGTPDLGTYGGEKGFAESGPISFETQWYEWGDYATMMIRRIRYHWYQNMPDLVRVGVKGVVVIRFTILRDGTITDITTLQSSGHPPFDFAARKALELSSPLHPLPEDFPKDSERVTAGFYYNLRPPGK